MNIISPFYKEDTFEENNFEESIKKIDPDNFDIFNRLHFKYNILKAQGNLPSCLKPYFLKKGVFSCYRERFTSLEKEDVLQYIKKFVRSHCIGSDSHYFSSELSKEYYINSLEGLSSYTITELRFLALFFGLLEDELLCENYSRQSNNQIIKTLFPNKKESSIISYFLLNKDSHFLPQKFSAGINSFP
jgi:hypothetical protein